MTLAESVTSIAVSAFDLCYGLDFNVYDNCRYLESEINPYYALIKTEDPTLSEYEIHSDTKIIANEAFSGRTNLKSIVFQGASLHIGKRAFYDCMALTNVSFGKGVLSVGEEVFARCSALSSLRAAKE